MILAFFLLPALAGLLAFFLRSEGARRGLLVGCALLHALLTACCWMSRPAPALGGVFQLDAPGLLFLSITSLLFLAAAVYAVGYLRREEHRHHRDFEEGFLFRNTPEATFVACLLFFLATMSLVALSQHFGLLWVAVEATTLASAPLIYFHRHHRSLEATWKYLLICSVGIALALLGNLFLAIASSARASTPLLLGELTRPGASLHLPWLQAAFLFLLVGYGTKMGLAPLHTWLPDAHSEAPSVVSALLSGALLNCAFLGILRIHQVCVAAGEGAFSRQLLVLFGLLSLVFAAFFIIGQADYKRLLAYSSVEHMGVLALGMGLGGGAVFGSLLHALNHSLTKALLFFVAGDILARYQTRLAPQVRGVLAAAPLTGMLWLAGFLAIAGSPPFGLFMSEFVILKAALDQGHYGVAAALLGALGLVFAGMAPTVLGMVQGRAGETRPAAEGERLILLPPLALALAVLLLGIFLPPFLSAALRQAAQALGGG